ncbi:MAG: ankyrin repeat domain-containing protein [Fimbriimonadales bacterium]
MDKPPALPADLVKEFVIAAHGAFDKTKTLLAKTPALLNATWDWGGGDFESAIGGAGHMGRRDIALFLIENGARTDIFVAAMLGELDVVKAYLAKHPNMAKSGGPHGIPLIAHAEAGGAEAKAVLDHLKTLG